MDDAKLEAVRPYALEYITGVLWLIAAGSVLGSAKAFYSALDILDSAGKHLAHVRVPDIVAALITTIVGIILPYCGAVVLRPITLVLMNVLLAFQRKARGAAHKERMDLRFKTRQAIDRHLQTEAHVSTSLQLFLLEVLQPLMARRLIRATQDLQFRVGVVIPISLIIAEATKIIAGVHLYNPWSTVAGVITGCLFFFVAVWLANSQFERLLEETLAALLITLEREKRAESGAA